MFALNIVINISITHAQEKLNYFEYNELNSELGSNFCYNVFQTSNGKVFISSAQGLQSFDGLNFKTYAKEGKGIAISSSLEDSTGRLWANSFYGDIYYMHNDSLITHPVSDSINEITNFHYLGNDLFLTTYSEIYKLNYTSLAFEKLIGGVSINNLFAYQDNNYAIYVKGGDKKARFINLSTSEKTIVEDYNISILNSLVYYFNNEPFIYFTERNESYSLKELVETKKPKKTIFSYPGKVNYIQSFNGEILIGGMNGILFYNEKGELKREILEKIQISNIHVDEEGNYLATSLTDGFIQIPSLNNAHFSYEKYLDNESITLSDLHSSSLLVHATNAGILIKHNLETNEIDTVRLSARSEVSALAVDTFKNLVYAYSDALYIVDFNSFQIIDKYLVTSVKNIGYNKDFILLGARNGLYYVKNHTLKVLDFIGWNLSICSADENSFIASFKEGLYNIDSTLQISKIYTEDEAFPTTVKSIVKHKNDTIFFIGNHQNIYTYYNDSLSLLYTHPSNNLTNIVISDDSLYVLASNEVLIIPIDETGNKYRLNKNKGLFEKKTIDFFHFNNHYYFTHNKAISILKELPKKNKVQPKVYYKITNGTFTQENQTLVSSYKNNHLWLNIDIPNNLRARGETQILFRINKLSSEWQKVEKDKRELSFERLPFGKYTLEILAKNEDGVLSEKLTLNLHIKPPFYLQKWFLLLVIILFLIITYGFTQFFIHRNNKKNKEKLIAQKLKVRALNAELTAMRSQMNPHFIFNLLTSMQSKVIEGKSEEVYKTIGNFSQLIRNVLDKSGNEFININEEIAFLKNYVALENSRLSNPIKLFIEIDNESYFEQIQIPTLITQPFVENAIKHAFPNEKRLKKITLKLSEEKDGFSISIIDNGVGIDNSSSVEGHQSFAIKSIENRIKALGEISIYDIYMEIDSSPNGTKIKLVFKFK